LRGEARSRDRSLPQFSARGNRRRQKWLRFETASGYRFYFAVYVRNVSRFTPVYMALIDPFRNLIVYPSLLRGIRATWNKTFRGA
jgi:hypothetical protein